MLSFSGKTALITGAGGGIGYRTTEQMLGAGANVVMVDNNAQALEKAAAALDPTGVRVAAVVADISSPAANTDLCATAARRFGRIDHLVHCAGMYPSVLARNCTDELWRKVMSVNLDGTFYLCRAAVDHMPEGGSMVLCASMAAHKGSYDHSAYAATKGGMLSFMRSLALELAPAIRVNAVSPGIIATDMTGDLITERGKALLAATPLKRYGRPEEVAAAILFLSSPLASFITGETIHINGGMYMD